MKPMLTLRRVLAALLGLGTAIGAQAMTPAEVFAQVSPSVWLVRTYDKEGLPLGTGSAVVTAADTMVTNCHVLRKAARFTANHEKTALEGTLEMWDVPRDICQFKVRGLTAPAVRLGNSEQLAVGQPVYAIGNPKALELTLSSGLISSLRRDDKQQLSVVQTSAPISPGSSGGGLFDDQARLVGITSAVLVGTGVQNLNFAYPVDYVRELPARHAAAQAQRTAAAASAAAVPKAPVAAPVAPVAPVAPAAPTQVATAAVTSAPRATLSDRVPFLNDTRQEEVQRFLQRTRSPRACAIADNGNYACTDGMRVTNPALPANPQDRALQICANIAGKACALYVVDDTVVYTRP